MAIGGILGRTFKVPSRAAVKPQKLTSRPAGPAPHYDWAALSDNFLWQWYNDPKRRGDRAQGIFHPSAGLHPSMGSCERQLMFELVFAPLSSTRIPAHLARVLMNGTNRHVGLQSMFVAMADNGYMGIVQAECELEVQHPVLPIYGHADLRLTFRDGFRYLFDFKTWSSNNCAKTYEPALKHKIQLITYMGCLGLNEAYGIPGYMIYENKDNQKWLSPMERFRIEFDKKVFNEIEDFCRDILAGVAAQELPEFDETVCKDSLMFCPYKVVCDAERVNKSTWKDFDRRPESIKRRHLEVVQ